MINLINRLNITEEYPKMAESLSRALTKTDLSSFWTLEDLFHHVVNDEVIVFVQQESGYYGVLQKGSAPQASILHFFWSGKDPVNEVPVDWDEVDDFLIHAARQLRVSHIQCEGRRGWKPILLSRGYSEDSVVYTKKVPYELPPI